MGNQPPFRPDELLTPPMQGTAFVHFLQREKTRKYPAAPPFLHALIRGELSIEQLRMWVQDLYPYWNEGLVFATGAVYIKTNDEPSRTQMLRRMVDLEGKEVVNDLTGATTPAYEELWLRFGEGIGLERDEVLEWQQFTRTYFSMRTLMTYSRYWDWTWLDGVATWYAADLFWREHYAAVRQALLDRYGVAPDSLEFFDVLLSDLATHLPWEEQGLAYWACTTERQLTAARAFRERLDIEYQLLFALNEARAAERLPFQVPA